MGKKRVGGIKTAGIRAFRAKLSQYVRDVKQGDTVQVTDRGQVVACLVPPEVAELGHLSPVDRARQQMLADGVFSKLGNRKMVLPPLPEGPGFTLAEVDEALDWTRGDR